MGQPIAAEIALQSSDALWAAFDCEYAMFAIKPDLDWAHLRNVYRPYVEQVQDQFQVAELLGEMLAHREDVHVAASQWRRHATLFSSSEPNTNRQAIPKMLGSLSPVEHNVAWSLTVDGMGYIIIDRPVCKELQIVHLPSYAKDFEFLGAFSKLNRLSFAEVKLTCHRFPQ